ncbi:MAG: hypothetical protein Q4A13_03955 [Fretibacterium sp.]|nr:hypothetical protein [Fretibacterium sp.]
MKKNLAVYACAALLSFSLLLTLGGCGGGGGGGEGNRPSPNQPSPPSQPGPTPPPSPGPKPNPGAVHLKDFEGNWKINMASLRGQTKDKPTEMQRYPLEPLIKGMDYHLKIEVGAGASPSLLVSGTNSWTAPAAGAGHTFTTAEPETIRAPGYKLRGNELEIDYPRGRKQEYDLRLSADKKSVRVKEDGEYSIGGVWYEYELEYDAYIN